MARVLVLHINTSEVWQPLTSVDVGRHRQCHIIANECTVRFMKMACKD